MMHFPVHLLHTDEIDVRVLFHWNSGSDLGPFAQNVLLIPLHLRQPRFADGDIFGFAVVIPHGTEGERAGFFLEGEAGSVVAGKFGGADGGRFEQRQEEGAEQVARADDPRGDAVDARVEVIEAEVDAVEVAVGDDFAGDGQEVVGEGDDVVAVPPDPAAELQQNVRKLVV
jgi:hypothetical protein